MARGLAWLLSWCIAAMAGAAPAPEPTVPRHPEETRALTAPADVLAGLPALRAAAQARGDARELALLSLAESNACRMLSRLSCQAEAAAQARRIAQQAAAPDLEVRGYVLEASAAIVRQDFTHAEQLMLEAEATLRRHPHPLLLGDVMLAYSSISYALGNVARSEDYARRGLDALGTAQAHTIRVRLLRNLARAQAQQGRYDEAMNALASGLGLIPPGEDPRLRAELHTEAARLGQHRGDAATQREHAGAALAIGEQLDIPSVRASARELLADVEQSSGDAAAAEALYGAALQDFMRGRQPRDERRMLRRLIALELDRGDHAAAEPHVRRLIELGTRLEAQDQAAIAANFDVRLTQAQQAYEMQLLQQTVQAAERQQTLLRWLIAAGMALSIVLAGAAIAQRRSSARLAEALARARDNEARYQALTTELQQAQQTLEQLARIDSLTGVANRRHFEERLDAVLAHARRMSRGVAVLALDLDRFKEINDSLGHAAGDAVLREFVARVSRSVRKDDFLARVGGDEFMLIVEEPPAVAGEVIARKLLAAMQAPMTVFGHPVQASVSIGVAFGDGRSSAEQLLATADEALYAAKAEGRATFVVRQAGPRAAD